MSDPTSGATPTRGALAQAGLPRQDVAAWSQAAPAATADLDADRARFGAYWLQSGSLLSSLPPKANRNSVELAAAHEILTASRASRVRFLRAHARAVYESLTARRSSFLRLEVLLDRAAKAFPGLVPSEAELAREAGLALRDKDGLEIDQGLFAAQVLADPVAGLHLCHAMLLPRAEARERLPKLERAGAVDLGAARVERRGVTSVLTMSNPRVLNAEDASTLDATEIAADLALLDPRTQVCVLQGDTVAHPKHAGRRLFGAGINLTHLYQGKIPYRWYLVRDLGFVNKCYRGLALPDVPPEEDSIEKLWIAALDGFAIGGHCQLLLAMDCVIAGENAYMTLPARKEGIVPGAANLRLARRVGHRVARQAILAEHRIDCASAEGRLICDAVVAPDAVDAAVERMALQLSNSGAVSAASNRRALRAGEEPLEAFRRYMAVYAREQAYCHFSPALVTNLEANWNAGGRAL